MRHQGAAQLRQQPLAGQPIILGPFLGGNPQRTCRSALSGAREEEFGQRFGDVEQSHVHVALGTPAGIAVGADEAAAAVDAAGKRG